MSTPLQPAPCNLPHHIITPTDAYAHLLTSCPEVFRPELRQTAIAPAKHGIYHHIKTMGPPVFAKFRRRTPERLAAAKQPFAKMDEIGLRHKASSPWSSPLDIVLKKDGSIRLCGDYRPLNMQTEPDHCPQTSPT
ncbi:uncharacterized protein [Palaemon carinicauda]|uniref:uncharacterized protein n=1 Tax=Palaemon carinicauda TaxID=392227 RepID=UPI0035B5DB6E